MSMTPSTYMTAGRKFLGATPVRVTKQDLAEHRNSHYDGAVDADAITESIWHIYGAYTALKECSCYEWAAHYNDCELAIQFNDTEYDPDAIINMEDAVIRMWRKFAPDLRALILKDVLGSMVKPCGAMYDEAVDMLLAIDAYLADPYDLLTIIESE